MSADLSDKSSSNRVLEGSKAGVKPGSGGGVDGSASISSLTVRHHTHVASSATSVKSQQDNSLLTVALLPAGDTSFLLTDRQTGKVVAPAATSSLSSFSSKWVAVVYIGRLYDVVYGTFAARCASWSPRSMLCSVGAPSPSSSSSSAAAFTDVSSKGSHGGESSASTSFFFHLIPSADTVLVRGDGAAGSETCDDVLNRLRAPGLLSPSGPLPPLLGIGISVAIEEKGGQLISLRAYRESPLSQLEVDVAKRAGIDRSRVFLFLKGELLAGSDKSLAELGIRDRALLHLRSGPARISVECLDGTVLTLDIDPEEDDAYTVLGMIPEAKLAAPAGQYQGFANNHGGLIKAANGPLRALGICAGSVLRLCLVPAPWTVDLTLPDGTTIAMAVRPDEEAREFKRRVQQLSGVKPERQKFINSDSNSWLEKLNDSSWTEQLRYLDVSDGSRLSLKDGGFTFTAVLPDDSRIEVKLAPDADFNHFKALVTARTGIPAYDQYLFLDGSLVEPSDVPELPDVADGSTIEVRRGAIRITVEAVEIGRTFYVFAGPMDTVEQVKAKICDQCGANPLHRYLLFGEDEWLIEHDRHRLSWLAVLLGLVDLDVIGDDDEAVVPDFSVKLVPGPMEVHLNGVSGASFCMRRHSQDTVSSLVSSATELVSSLSWRNKSHYIAYDDHLIPLGENYSGRFASSTLEELGIADGFVLALSDGSATVAIQREEQDGGGIVLLTLPYSASLHSIKPAIEAATGIPVHDQYLQYEGRWLQDGESLLSQNMPIGATILLKRGRFPVKVDVNGGRASLQLLLNCERDEDTMDDVKTKVHALTGIAIEEQSFAPWFATGAISWPWRTHTLGALGLTADSSLSLFHGNMTVNFRAGPDQMPVPILICTSDTADAVLAKIEATTGIKPPSLMVHGMGLEMVGLTTVSSMGIQPGAELVPGQPPILLTVLQGNEEFTLPALKHYTVGYLATLLQGITGVSAEKRGLYANGQSLDDVSRTLAEYGILKDTFLVICLRRAGG